MIIWLPRICCERATSVNDDPYCKCWIEHFVRKRPASGWQLCMTSAPGTGFTSADSVSISRSLVVGGTTLVCVDRKFNRPCCGQKIKLTISGVTPLILVVYVCIYLLIYVAYLFAWYTTQIMVDRPIFISGVLTCVCVCVYECVCMNVCMFIYLFIWLIVRLLYASMTPVTNGPALHSVGSDTICDRRHCSHRIATLQSIK